MENEVKGPYDVRYGFKNRWHYRNIYQHNCEGSGYAAKV